MDRGLPVSSFVRGAFLPAAQDRLGPLRASVFGVEQGGDAPRGNFGVEACDTYAEVAAGGVAGSARVAVGAGSGAVVVGTSALVSTLGGVGDATTGAGNGFSPSFGGTWIAISCIAALPFFGSESNNIGKKTIASKPSVNAPIRRRRPRRLSSAQSPKDWALPGGMIIWRRP